jgi:excisionase family DNA binding protein
MEDKLLLTIGEVSKLIGIKISTIYHWVSQGRIPCFRLSSRCLRFRYQDIEKWIEGFNQPSIEPEMRRDSRRR